MNLFGLISKNPSLGIIQCVWVNENPSGTVWKQILKGSQILWCFFFLGKNFKIEFILDDIVRVESGTLSLSAQSVASGGGTSGGGSSGGKASTVGTAAQKMTLVISCLMGRVLLLETFMATVLSLNINLGKHGSFLLWGMYMSPHTEVPVNVYWIETKGMTIVRGTTGNTRDMVLAIEKVIASMVEMRQPYRKCYSPYMVAYGNVGDDKEGNTGLSVTRDRTSAWIGLGSQVNSLNWEVHS